MDSLDNNKKPVLTKALWGKLKTFLLKKETFEVQQPFEIDLIKSELIDD